MKTNVCSILTIVIHWHSTSQKNVVDRLEKRMDIIMFSEYRVLRRIRSSLTTMNTVLTELGVIFTLETCLVIITDDFLFINQNYVI